MQTIGLRIWGLGGLECRNVRGEIRGSDSGWFRLLLLKKDMVDPICVSPRIFLGVPIRRTTVSIQGHPSFLKVSAWDPSL